MWWTFLIFWPLSPPKHPWSKSIAKISCHSCNWTKTAWIEQRLAEFSSISEGLHDRSFWRLSLFSLPFCPQKNNRSWRAILLGLACNSLLGSEATWPTDKAGRAVQVVIRHPRDEPMVSFKCCLPFSWWCTSLSFTLWLRAQSYAHVPRNKSMRLTPMKVYIRLLHQFLYPLQVLQKGEEAVGAWKLVGGGLLIPADQSRSGHEESWEQEWGAGGCTYALTKAIPCLEARVKLANLLP